MLTQKFGDNKNVTAGEAVDDAAAGEAGDVAHEPGKPGLVAAFVGMDFELQACTAERAPHSE